MNNQTMTMSSISARRFAQMFVSTVLQQTPRPHHLQLLLRDGTDPQRGGHRAEPGGAA